MTHILEDLIHKMEGQPNRPPKKEKNPGCLGCIGDYTTQYMGILISQYTDP